MAKAAGIITINLNAGTAQFVRDLDLAKGKVRDFSQSASRGFGEAGRSAVSSRMAASGALRLLQGDLTNNIRAVENFISVNLKLGPVLQAAFPLIGLAAFGGMVFKVGTEVKKFFDEMEARPSKLASAWHLLNQPIRNAADELDLANARLQNDINKLEGKRTNGLAETLAAAKVAADKLGESLEKDLAALNKLLKEQDLSMLQGVFSGQNNIVNDALKKIFGGEHGMGGMAAQIQKINDAEAEQLEKLKTAPPRAPGGLRVAGMNDDELKRRAAQAISHSANQQRLDAYGKIYQGLGTFLGSNQDLTSGDRETLESTRAHLGDVMRDIRASQTNTDLTAKKGALEGDRSNEALDRPFQDRMKALQADLAGIQEKERAIGSSQSVRDFAAAWSASEKIIAEVNKALEHNHQALSDGQKEQIRAIENQIVSAESEVQFKTAFDKSTRSIQDRIESLRNLSAAIGQGYEAAEAANVQSRMQDWLGGQGHANDPKWQRDHASQINQMQGLFTQEYRANNKLGADQATDSLTKQIELENLLADAEKNGAEAVRLATLAMRIKEIQEKGGVEATRAQVHAEKDLYEAQRKRLNQQQLTSLDQQIAAARGFGASIPGGSDARRQAQLKAKYDQMGREGASDQVIGAEKTKDALEHQNEIALSAVKTAEVYREQLHDLDQQIDYLRQLKDEDVAISDLEQKRLEVLVQQALAAGRAQDGLRAFFIEMQEQGKKASQVVFDALNKTVDDLSDNLAKVMTGQKAAWAEMFRSIGQELLRDSIKQGLQKGIGALGKLLGINTDASKPDGSSPQKALWVRSADQNKQARPGGEQGCQGGAQDGGLQTGAVFGGGSQGGGIFSFLGGQAASMIGILAGLLGGGGGGGESVTSSISYGGMMADGGPVSPGMAYQVGENGREWFMPHTQGTIIPHDGFGGGGDTHNHYWNVDARGSDVGAAARIHAAMKQTHDQAVRTSTVAVHERSKRVPA